MSEKRIIEQEASNEVYSDDWFAKDSPTQDTSKILGSDLKAYMNEGMTSADTIADEYNSSTSYDVGDLCFYNGTLYVCTTATTGAWDGNDWSETTIEELIAESGKVQDVKVNGTSVVDVNKVAQIVSYKEVTQAEYNALPSSKNSDNVLYCIKDAVAPPYVEDVQVNGASLITNKVAILDSLTVDGTASGAIASFSDGSAFPMKSLKVAIEPQQDLHGYDAPWVGGAGKNKLPLTVEGIKNANTTASWNGNSTEINGITYTILTNDSGAVIGINANGIASANSVLRYFNSTSSPISLDGQSVTITIAGVTKGAYKDNTWHDLNNPSSETTITLSGSMTELWGQINSGVKVNNILITPMVRLASVADATFAPYSNICPISGWDEANVNVSGVNVWDEEWEVGSIADSNGQNATNSNYRRSKNYISVKANKKYYFNVPNKYGTTYRFYQYKQNKDYIGVKAVDSDGTFETDNDCAFIRFRIATTEEYTNDISINYPSTDTSYHAYNGSTITIQLGDTYYGGKLDVVSGVLTVDRAFVDMGTLTWSKNQTYWYNTSLVNVMKVYGYNEIPTLICSNYKTVKASDVVNGRETGISNFELSLGGLMVHTGDLENSPTGQLVYELATPTTIQLTPTQVSSLLGVNNVWADTGNIINATYIRDLNITINNLINA